MKSLILIGLSVLSLCSGTFGSLKTTVVSKAIENIPAKAGYEISLSKDEVDALTEMVINHSDKETIKNVKGYVEDNNYSGLYDYCKELLSDSEESSLKTIYNNHSSEIKNH